MCQRQRSNRRRSEPEAQARVPYPLLALRARMLLLAGMVLALVLTPARPAGPPASAPAPMDARPEPTNYQNTNRQLQAATGNVPGALASTIRFPLLSLACSPDGRTLAASGEEKFVKLVDTTTANVAHVLVGHEDVVAQVVFSPDGKTLASAGFDGDVRLRE